LLKEEDIMNLEEIMPLEYWLIALVGLICIIEGIYLILLHRKMKSFQKSYLALQTFLDGSSLDQQLKDYYSEVKNLRADLSGVEKRVSQAESKLRLGVDRAELIRFSAFENMGSDLSFALALLNQEGDGVVLSSINNRDESRVYAKPVVKGESTYHLSKEEQEVISKALKSIRV